MPMDDVTVAMLAFWIESLETTTFLMLLPLCDEPLFRYKQPYAAGLNAVAQVRLQHEALASLSPLHLISSSNKDKKA